MANTEYLIGQLSNMNPNDPSHKGLALGLISSIFMNGDQASNSFFKAIVEISKKPQQTTNESTMSIFGVQQPVRQQYTPQPQFAPPPQQVQPQVATPEGPVSQHAWLDRASLIV